MFTFFLLVVIMNKVGGSMKKNGFTLIELLSIIVILGVIALIAIPTISNIIDDAKINTFKNTASNYVEALYNKCTVNQAKGINPIIDINILNNENLGIDNLNGFINDDSKLPKVLGTTDEECNVSLAVYNEELKLCAYKLSDSDKIKTANVNNDYRCLLGANIKDEKDLYTVGYQSTDTSIVPTDSSCFIFNPGNGYISGYDINCPKDVIIPAYINGNAVTTIASYVFQNKGLESVLMPETITYIGTQAFSNNNITSLGLGIGVKTIKNDAFAKNLLTELVIPDSVTELSGFNYNKLEKITFGNGLSILGIYAFNYNYNLSEVDLSNCSNLTTIESDAFNVTGLKKILLPNSLTTIKLRAFQNSKLTGITIPESVQVIESKAFQTSTLAEINIINKTSLDQFTTLGISWNGSCNNINYISK